MILTFGLGLALLALAWAAPPVRVAAAANLAPLGPALQSAFRAAHPGLAVEFTFGASGGLVTQISQGAPFDVFLSADLSFAQKLVAAHLTTGPVRTYAFGTLILLSTRPLDFSRGLEVLRDPSLAQVALANPETAPYGQASVEALKAAGLWAEVQPRIVTAQTIAQALQFTLTATGLGFVAKSALAAPEVKPYSERGRYWVEVDPRLHGPLAQGGVVLAAASDPGAAEAFLTFLSSPEASKIFVDFGYRLP